MIFVGVVQEGVTSPVGTTNCSDPHFSWEGGTIYSTGFFCSVNFVESLKSTYFIEYGIKKISSIFVFYRELSSIKVL